jgi:hypothetical protein
MIDTVQTISQADLISLLDVTPAAARAFTLPSGKVLPNLFPISVNDYMLHIVARFDSVSSEYTEPFEVMKKLSKEEMASAVVDGKLDEDKLQSIVMGKMELTRLVRQNAAEEAAVNAAFVSIALGYGGNDAVEAAVLRMDEDDHLAILEEAQSRTWGADSTGFFERVAGRQRGMRRTSDTPPRSLGPSSKTTSNRRNTATRPATSKKK